jgi:hypothetical protein
MPPTPLSLALGTVEPRITGDSRFVDLVPDKEVELAPGAQGGFHVWTLYRVFGNSEAQRVRVRRIVDRLGSGDTRQRILTADGVQDLPAMPEWELPMPLPSFICPTPIAVSALDAPVELLVRLEKDETNGATLGEARVRLRLVCPPVGDPQRDFCLRICQG